MAFSELTFGLFMVPVASFIAALVIMSVVLPKLSNLSNPSLRREDNL